ncbi:hypothetical protein D3C72_2432940 [compost metagenome]
MTLQFAQVGQVADPFDARVAPARFPAVRQGMSDHGQAHRRVALPDLRKDILECPLDGFEAGVVFKIADKQQALAVQ